jgi:hypothetical protein
LAKSRRKRLWVFGQDHSFDGKFHRTSSLLPSFGFPPLQASRGNTPIDARQKVVAVDSENPFAAQANMVPAVVKPNDGGNEDIAARVIPYRNPKALIAYYTGLFSGLPVIGLPLGVAAIALGILGLRDRQRDPSIHGSVHAWIGIGCGGFFALFWFGIIALAITAMLISPSPP